jgi:putative transcriptional regulator
MEFIEAPAFTRYLPSYLNDDGYKELQTKLGANPELGDLMPGTGGFRKLRWPDARRGKGRRGGLRVIYYYFSSDSQMGKATIMAKRNIFGELMDGVAAMKNHREGKLTLRRYKMDVTPLPKVDSKLLRDTRKKLRCSRAVFARKLRINERTLEKWEQGRARPNPQAAALVLLVRKYPDTIERLDTLSAR